MRPALDALRRGGTRAGAWSLCLAVAACGSGASGDGQGPAAVSEYALQPSHVLITLESGLLAGPREISPDASGNVHVLDPMDRRVVSLTPEGALLRTVGRRGDGPGEMTSPLALGVDRADRLRIFDFGKRAVHVFGSDGSFQEQYEVDFSGIPSQLSFSPEGSLAYSGTRPNGQGALLAVLDEAGRQVALVGELVSPEVDIPPTLLEELHRRELPGFMRNNVLPRFAPDGSLWLFLQTEGRLLHVAADGQVLLDAALAVPEMPAILESYFDWYATVPENSMILRYLEYVADMEVTERAIWLLWSPAGEAAGLVTLHDPATGELMARLSLGGITQPAAVEASPNAPPLRRRIAIDLERRTLYVLDPQGLRLVGFDLPPELASR